MHTKMMNSQDRDSGRASLNAFRPSAFTSNVMPLEMVVTRPLQMNCVASVVIHALSFSFEVMKPFIAPISAPLATPTRIQATMPSAGEPATVLSPHLSQATPIMMPAKQPFMPTDRSTSPQSVTSA